MSKRRILFETWAVAQFDLSKEKLRLDETGAYADTIVSALWFGFNAGIESHTWQFV